VVKVPLNIINVSKFMGVFRNFFQKEAKIDNPKTSTLKPKRGGGGSAPAFFLRTPIDYLDTQGDQSQIPKNKSRVQG
jgi:hypothetical protein